MGAQVDVAVVGGGPAGAAAALTLCTHTARSVALIERSGYDTWRAGETLGPGGPPLLQYLDAWAAFQGQAQLPSAGTAAAWGGPDLAAHNILFTAPGQSWHLDRQRFDAGLAALAGERGAQLMTCTTVRAATRNDAGGWRLTLRPGLADGPTMLDARIVIDASGPAAVFARPAGARRLIGDHLLGLVGIYRRDPGHEPGLVITLVEATADGWWYAAPLPDNRQVIAFLSDPDLIRQQRLHDPAPWTARLRTTRHVSRLLRGAVLLAGPVARPAGSYVLEPAAGDGWVAAGDAAVGYDPLSSRGIGYALLSGIEAARTVDTALAGHPAAITAYATSVARHYARYHEQHAAYYRLERRWPESPFWRRRQAAEIER